MTRSWAIIVLCLVYAGVSLAASLSHDHAGGSGLAADPHCAACAWQTTSVAEVPPRLMPPEQSFIEHPLFSGPAVFIVRFFSPCLASRPPPIG